MNIVLLIVNWLLSIIVALIALGMGMLAGPLRGLLLFAIALVINPASRTLAQRLSGISLSLPLRLVVVAVLIGGFILLNKLDTHNSVYKAQKYEDAHLKIYDEKLAQWPLPYEERYVDTEYGKIHVVISGPQDAPPMLLLNASGLSAWSWLYNIEPLNKIYRTYAVDTIGEAGKSRLSDVNHIPADGQAWAKLMAVLTDKLGFEKSTVVGASYGGYIATNYALYHPERVEKLALLGPMGMTPATGETAMRIMLAQFYPFGPVKASTARWALGEDPYVLQESAEWFENVMGGMVPKVSLPLTFTPEKLQSMQVPVLLVIGTRDRLTSDPEKVRELANNVPDIRIEVLDSGHLIGIEMADIVNSMVPEFFTQP